LGKLDSELRYIVKKHQQSLPRASKKDRVYQERILMAARRLEAESSAPGLRENREKALLKMGSSDQGYAKIDEMLGKGYRYPPEFLASLDLREKVRSH